MTERTDQGESEIVRHEEELEIGTRPVEVGSVRLRKAIDVDRVSEVLPRDVEHAEVERSGPSEQDSGRIETLPDGSVSVPVFEEELVVTKRMVVRERIVIRKRTVTEERRVEEELRRERVQIESTPGVELEGSSVARHAGMGEMGDQGAVAEGRRAPIGDDLSSRFEGNWDRLRGRVKEAWGDLTDDELDRTEGRYEQLFGAIKRRTGESDEVIEQRLRGLLG